jgi:uncharacterized membrane protein YfcA
MNYAEVVLLFLSGFTAGVINSVAGGGALVIFPLLISMGLTPKISNTTTSIGVFGGQVSSAYGYKEFIKNVHDKRIFIFLIIGLIGGIVGAFALDKTSNDIFESLAPWFVLIAVALILLQPIIAKIINKINSKKNAPKLAMFSLLCVIMSIISIYGGFFGAGVGIIVFAILGFAGVKNVNRINGLKNIITISINLSANVYFIASGLVSWDYAVIIFTGSVFGGYIGSKTASRLPAPIIRSVVIICGIIATVVLFRR